MDDRAAWLRLTLCPGLGPAAQRTLLAAFGLPEQVFAAGRSAITSVVGGPSADLVFAAPNQARIDAALAWSCEANNSILTLADTDYPASLLDISDPPILLYVKGDSTLLNRPALAMVGARSATPQGIANAEAFARSLATTGLTIVSGLALGIDAAAHRGALAADSGTTIAVIGTGADRIYPARNKALAHKIAAHGAIISEYPLGTPPLPHNFPRRNRIIAGMARGVLIVEAAVSSGSLITARLANESGREVFAIPGSIHSPLARGCHRLIRDGAKLVETAQDVLDELQWGHSHADFNQPRPTHQRPAQVRPPELEHVSSTVQPPTTLPPEAAKLLAAIGHDPVDLDTIAQRSGLTLDALYAILLPLELDGHISRLPGGRFQRL